MLSWNQVAHWMSCMKTMMKKGGKKGRMGGRTCFRL